MAVQEKARHRGVILMDESLRKVSRKAVLHPGNSHNLLSTYCMLGSMPYHYSFLLWKMGVMITPPSSELF